MKAQLSVDGIRENVRDKQKTHTPINLATVWNILFYRILTLHVLDL